MSERKTDDPPIVHPRGRPKNTEPGANLSAWVPASQYDRLVRQANAHDQSVSSLVRDLLKTKLK